MLLPFAVGMIAGVVLGTIIIGFLAVGAYERGFQDALVRRGARITELRARHIVAARRFAAAKKAS